MGRKELRIGYHLLDDSVTSTLFPLFIFGHIHSPHIVNSHFTWSMDCSTYLILLRVYHMCRLENRSKFNLIWRHDNIIPNLQDTNANHKLDTEYPVVVKRLICAYSQGAGSWYLDISESSLWSELVSCELGIILSSYRVNCLWRIR